MFYIVRVLGEYTHECVPILIAWLWQHEAIQWKVIKSIFKKEKSLQLLYFQVKEEIITFDFEVVIR